MATEFDWPARDALIFNSVFPQANIAVASESSDSTASITTQVIIAAGDLLTKSAPRLGQPPRSAGTG